MCLITCTQNNRLLWLRTWWWLRWWRWRQNVVIGIWRRRNWIFICQEEFLAISSQHMEHDRLHHIIMIAAACLLLTVASCHSLLWCTRTTSPGLSSGSLCNYRSYSWRWRSWRAPKSTMWEGYSGFKVVADPGSFARNMRPNSNYDGLTEQLCDIARVQYKGQHYSPQPFWAMFWWFIKISLLVTGLTIAASRWR